MMAAAGGEHFQVFQSSCMKTTKIRNPFKFGQRVMVPGRSSSRIITEVVDDKNIRVLDIVEMSERQRADWTRNGVKGEFKLIPGMVVNIEGVVDWDDYMIAFEKHIGYKEKA